MVGKLSCANHLEADAQFFCPQCDKHLCAACSKHIWAASGFVDQCLACDALLQRLGETAISTPGARVGDVRVSPGAAAFVERIPDILRYPLQRSVLLSMAGLSVIIAPLEWAAGQPANMFGYIGFVMIWGLVTAFYFHMIQTTANGVETLEVPDFDNLFDDFVWPILLILLANLPFYAGVIWYGSQRWGAWEGGLLLIAQPSDLFNYPGPTVVVLAGLALLPLLTSIAALSHSATSVLNPKLWLESIRIMASTYPIAVAAFYGVMLFEIFAYNQLLLKVRFELDIPIVTGLLVTFLSLVPLTLKARILGALCEPYLGNYEE